MIGRLSGKLLEKNPPQIVLDVNGVGYELDVPMSTFYHLPAVGESVSLHTHMAVREDGHFLYGFLTADERLVFRMLLKVSGIGARTSLAILSGLSVSEFAIAIAQQEAGRLVKIPGIGKKTAERLLLELKGKLGSLTTSGSLVESTKGTFVSGQSDILNALMALGYNEKEALGAMKNLPEEADVSQGIRMALRVLSKV